MLRLAKYLKPYLPLILIAIVLLFIQANADLALPDYMSKIVNNGIQQGGVESAVPAAIRQSEMNRLVIFMSADDKAQVLGAYTLVDQSAPDYAETLKEYPGLANEPDLCAEGSGPSNGHPAQPQDGQGFAGGFRHRAGDGRPGQGRGAEPGRAGTRLRPVQAPAGNGSLRPAGQAAGGPAGPDDRRDRPEVRRAGRQHDHPGGGGAGQGRVRRAGHGYRQAPDQLHPAHRRC